MSALLFDIGMVSTPKHEYSQIISIADVYSALTSLRAYRHRYTPSDAIEFLLATGNVSSL